MKSSLFKIVGILAACIISSYSMQAKAGAIGSTDTGTPASGGIPTLLATPSPSNPSVKNGMLTTEVIPITFYLLGSNTLPSSVVCPPNSITPGMTPPLISYTGGPVLNIFLFQTGFVAVAGFTCEVTISYFKTGTIQSAQQYLANLQNDTPIPTNPDTSSGSLCPTSLFSSSWQNANGGPLNCTSAPFTSIMPATEEICYKDNGGVSAPAICATVYSGVQISGAQQDLCMGFQQTSATGVTLQFKQAINTSNGPVMTNSSAVPVNVPRCGTGNLFVIVPPNFSQATYNLSYPVTANYGYTTAGYVTSSSQCKPCSGNYVAGTTSYNTTGTTSVDIQNNDSNQITISSYGVNWNSGTTTPSPSGISLNVINTAISLPLSLPTN